MTVSELREYLKHFPQEAEVLVASDEELNNIYIKFEVAILESENELEEDNKVVIYGEELFIK